jgi:hypothetical protein
MDLVSHGMSIADYWLGNQREAVSAKAITIRKISSGEPPRSDCKELTS